MDPKFLRKRPSSLFIKYTNGFSKENYIGKFQFGEVYRGRIHCGRHLQDVLVKMWDVTQLKDNQLRLMEELFLLRNERLVCHPCLVKVQSYCSESEYLGVIYDFKPMDTVYNLLPQDSFTLLQRIKVALGLAHLLKFLHARRSSYDRFGGLNIDPSHIMVDEEYTPKVIDCNGLSGINFFNAEGFDSSTGESMEKFNVHAFGVMLLCLITKKVCLKEEITPQTLCEHEQVQSKFNSLLLEHPDHQLNEQVDHSIVGRYFYADPSFYPADGLKITSVAMQCLEPNPEVRPTMKQVFKDFRKLQIVKRHADFLGLDKLLSPFDAFDPDFWYIDDPKPMPMNY